MMVVMVNHDGNFNHQSGWWLLLTPLKNHGGSESQLGIFPFPIYMESKKNMLVVLTILKTTSQWEG